MGKGESETKEPNRIVLSYYDCLLRTSDVALLKGPDWLNDVLIGFYFEYLDNEINRQSERKEFLFVSPELTQLLKMTEPSEYATFLGSVGASESNFIFFPLNNCDEKDSAGGSHWSLLVYSKPDQLCFHYDSSSGYNRSAARKFANSITGYFLGNSRDCVEAACPQQQNGYDCGIYVLCFTDVLLDYARANQTLKRCNCNAAERLVPTKRSKLLSLIDQLKSTHSV